MPSRRKKAPADVLDAITPEEALDLLKTLLKAHPTLADDARRLATAKISKVDRAGVAEQVVAAIDVLDFADLSRRGDYQAYVEPTEGAWEALGEAVQPFIAEIERLVSIGLEPAARSQCEGVLLGLYALRSRARDHDLLGMAPDFPGEAAGNAVAAWLHAPGGPRRFDDDLLHDELSGWVELVTREQARCR